MDNLGVATTIDSLTPKQKWAKKNPYYMKEYYLRNKEKWIRSNCSPEAVERRREQARERYRNNKAPHNERALAHYRANKDHYRKLMAVRARTFEGRFSQLKSRARQGEIAVLLTFDEYCSVAKDPCYYCGAVLIGKTGSGLDRKDSSGDYEMGNILPCCYSCNRLKGAELTVEETKAAVTAIKELRWSKVMEDFVG